MRRVARTLAKEGSGITIELLAGGEKVSPEHCAAHVIVATASSLRSNVEGGGRAKKIPLDAVKGCVLDEADSLVSSGGGAKDITVLLNHLKDPQIMLFSATFNGLAPHRLKDEGDPAAGVHEGPLYGCKGNHVARRKRRGGGGGGSPGRLL